LFSDNVKLNKEITKEIVFRLENKYDISNLENELDNLINSSIDKQEFKAEVGRGFIGSFWSLKKRGAT